VFKPTWRALKITPIRRDRSLRDLVSAYRHGFRCGIWAAIGKRRSSRSAADAEKLFQSTQRSCDADASARRARSCRSAHSSSLLSRALLAPVPSVHQSFVKLFKSGHGTPPNTFAAARSFKSDSVADGDSSGAARFAADIENCRASACSFQMKIQTTTSRSVFWQRRVAGGIRHHSASRLWPCYSPPCSTGRSFTFAYCVAGAPSPTAEVVGDPGRAVRGESARRQGEKNSRRLSLGVLLAGALRRPSKATLQNVVGFGPAMHSVIICSAFASFVVSNLPQNMANKLSGAARSPGAHCGSSSLPVHGGRTTLQYIICCLTYI